MTKVLSFRVSIVGLENKIWREIEITELRSVADLAYTILASFDSLSYHLYDITHGDDTYNSMFYGEPFLDNNNLIAKDVKLNKVNFEKIKEMVMCYDSGSSTYFSITYIGSKPLEMGSGKKYPCVVSGAGKGMMDDISSEELQDIVDEIDKGGEFYYTAGYERDYPYDYREYDLDGDNASLKERIEKIKDGYENVEF